MTALRSPAPSPFATATVAEVCRRGVLTCAPEAEMGTVAATMASHEVHAAVIFAPDSGRSLVVTDLDLVRAALGENLDGPVADIAREPMATIAPEAPLAEAVAMMARRDVAHLLVARADGDRPSGVLSSLDVASALGGRDPAVTRTIRPGPARSLVSAARLSATTVGAVMHSGVISCLPSASVQEIASTMADRRVHCVAVAGVASSEDVDEHLVWGLLTSMDVVHAAHRGELGATASEQAIGAPLALVEPAGLDRAAALMVGHGARHVVAVGSSGLPSGIVSTLDVLRIVAAR